MIRKKREFKKHNTKIAVFFVIFVLLIILGSIVFKTVKIIGESKFDGRNRFTIKVSNSKNLQILSFSPSSDSISVLDLEGDVEELNLNKYLAIPTDGFIEADFLDLDDDLSSLMSSVFWRFGKAKTDLTIVDIFRLFLASNSVPLKNVLASEISISREIADADKIIDEMFVDKAIEEEDLSIEIINATPVTGLGSRLSRLIGNMGGKVVQVSTDNVYRKKSQILYDGDKIYTPLKLQKVLGFDLDKKKRQYIGDITIIIGVDSKNSELF